MTDPTPELLSAASLALAALAVLFGLWSADLNRAASLPRKSHIDDRGPAIKELRSVQRSKSVPLAISCALTAIVIAPPAVQVVIRAIDAVRVHGAGAITRYDAGEALFLVVWLLIVALTASMIRTSVKLQKQIRDFSTPP